MTAKERKKRLLALGYELSRNQKDMFGKRRAFRTFPIKGSGVANYFDTILQVEKYIERVEKNRRLFADDQQRRLEPPSVP